MELRGRQLFICNCEGTNRLDSEKLGRALSAVGAEGTLHVHHQLCRAELGRFQGGLQDGARLLVACRQEAPLFEEVAAEEGREVELSFVDVRDAGGWSDEAAASLPKTAALLAAASLPAASPSLLTLTSRGECLVYGRDEAAIAVAKRLAARLQPTALVTHVPPGMPPRVMDVPVFTGRIVEARGHLGDFDVVVDHYAPLAPSARETYRFESPRNGARSRCDLIVDLTGDPPLFPGGGRREGYLRADPADPVAVERLLFEVADLVGTFDKPRYVNFDADVCAHSRNRRTGCTRCLDACPLGAIAPAGDVVAVDTGICGGCGLCSALCPTGAVAYALPPDETLLERLRVLLRTYGAAGGRPPVLLVHDEDFGAEAIAMAARLDAGLPADTLPVPVNSVLQLGLDFYLTALAFGASSIALLLPRAQREDATSLAGPFAWTETLLTALGFQGGRLHLLDEADAADLAAVVRRLPRPAPVSAAAFLPLGGKRGRSWLAMRSLHEAAAAPPEQVSLPAGAPFGAVRVDRAGCTLCLACVSACPTGALQDDPERPWLGFNEEACVQCGLCRSTCPERVITLEPRVNFTDEARGVVELSRAQPFPCLRCGKPFGVRPLIEKIADRLAGRHWMYSESRQAERLMLCEDCRVGAEFETGAQPFAAGPRPRGRTTEDDLREREQRRGEGGEP